MQPAGTRRRVHRYGENKLKIMRLRSANQFRSMGVGATCAAALVLLSAPLCAQVDLSGSWASRNHEDQLERGLGPPAVDYSGLPLNEDGRVRALSYSESQLSEPERICLFYPPYYMMLGPFGIKMWSESDPATGAVISWKI